MDNYIDNLCNINTIWIDEYIQLLSRKYSYQYFHLISLQGNNYIVLFRSDGLEKVK